jgi:hypothetical protein
MTFFKEGLATLAEFFYHARLAASASQGSTSPAHAATVMVSPRLAIADLLNQRVSTD